MASASATKSLPVSAPVETWSGCYDESWRGVIVPEAFAHPAKMSRALVARIFDDLFASGALRRGDVVVDPFGGIGTTCIEATVRGVRGFACELEPRFIGLGHQNFALHRDLWLAQGRTMPVLVQGNSRQLRAALAPVMADAVVGSPPYADSDQNYERGVKSVDWTKGTRAGLKTDRCSGPESSYGATEGQLAAMPAGTVDAIVSSPPFATGDSASAQSMTTRTDKSAAWVKANCGSAATEGYGASDGQLGVMTMGSVADALVSSPPYEGRQVKESGIDMSKTRINSKQGGANSQARISGYVGTDGQLGESTGDTFWFAARDIVAESFAILKPGGLAYWVVKAYVKKGRIVDFPGDWRRLCEHVGFEMVKEVRAMLVKEETRTDLLSGEDITVRRERKSFFRRLAEKKGSPRIDFEVVLVMRKPLREVA